MPEWALHRQVCHKFSTSYCKSIVALTLCLVHRACALCIIHYTKQTLNNSTSWGHAPPWWQQGWRRLMDLPIQWLEWQDYNTATYISNAIGSEFLCWSLSLCGPTFSVATKMGATQCQERVHSTVNVLASCTSCRAYAHFVLDLCAACHLWCARML